MLILLLSLNLIVAPNPVKTVPGRPVKLTITLPDTNLNLNPVFTVKPSELGRVQDKTFFPDVPGKGVIICRVEVGGETLKKIVYVVVGDTLDVPATITPHIARVNIGESVKFSVTGGKVKKWKVIPERIGSITEGMFTGKNPGKGRVVAILEDGRVLTAMVFVGRMPGRIRIVPGFRRMKSGESFRFTVEPELENPHWSVLPPRIGRITSDGEFTAGSPGRCVVMVKGTLDGKEVAGKAVVIVTGGGLRIIPERALLKKGESVRFTVQDEAGRVIEDVKWKVVPRRIGRIDRNGMFYGTGYGKGKVIVILPDGYTKKALNVPVFVLPDRHLRMYIYPPFVKLDNVTSVPIRFSAGITGTDMHVPIKYRVYPEDFGTITPQGDFTPLREGTGVVIAEPAMDLPVKPARAVVVVGKIMEIKLKPSSNTIVRCGQKVKFSPLEPIPGDIKLIWRVDPYKLGKITQDGVFEANPLPPDVNEVRGRVILIAVSGTRIVGYGVAFVTVVR